MRNVMLLSSVLLAGCSEPLIDDVFTTLDVLVTPDEQGAADRMIAAIDTAEDTVHMAIAHMGDPAIADAAIAASDRGVDVKVVTDVDQAGDAGIQALFDADIDVRLADGPVTYFDFNANDDVTWDSDQVLMSHSYVVVDDLRVVNSTAAGNLGGGAQVVFELQGEDISEDLFLEHNQVFGGSDATALTAFSAPAKSQADVRWLYNTNSDTMFELWLGPQERVTKRVIDAIYTARRSVRVMTNELANDGLARALQDKSSWGFDVELIVGPGFGNTLQQLEDQVNDASPDVQKFRFEDDVDLPTIILIDIEGRDGDLDVMPRAYILSHDLYSASRFYQDRLGRLLEVTTDQLIDGNLCVLSDEDYVNGSDDASHLQPVVDLYMDHLNRAGDF